jgi:hypothetical protein
MVFVRRRQAESDLQMRAWLAEGAAAEGSRRRPQDEKFTIKTLKPSKTMVFEDHSYYYI